MSSTTIPRDALSPDKKACLVFDISNEALVKPAVKYSKTGTQSVENTPCAATFRASLLKITSFRWKPKMRLRANPVVGGSGCGAVGDRALPELPADIKDQLPTVGNVLRRRPRPTFKLYQKSLSFCRRIHNGIMAPCLTASSSRTSTSRNRWPCSHMRFRPNAEPSVPHMERRK